MDEAIAEYLRRQQVLCRTAWEEWVNEKHERSGGKFSLPTEAQWEYACRAGSTTRFSFGDDEAGLGEHAWCGELRRGTTHPVGLKKPNAWGLYDMHGNVWEWCADWYNEDYYATQPVDDPTGPSSGTCRVLRGSSFGDHPMNVRSAVRNWDMPVKSGVGKTHILWL